MKYGILFFVDTKETIWRVCLLSSEQPIKEKVFEDYVKEGNTMAVRRTVMLPTEREFTYQEAEEKAKEWYKDFREQRIIDVIRGD